MSIGILSWERVVVHISRITDYSFSYLEMSYLCRKYNDHQLWTDKLQVSWYYRTVVFQQLTTLTSRVARIIFLLSYEYRITGHLDRWEDCVYSSGLGIKGVCNVLYFYLAILPTKSCVKFYDVNFLDRLKGVKF